MAHSLNRIGLIVVVTLMSSGVAFAQAGGTSGTGTGGTAASSGMSAQSPGTNSAGTAQSSDGARGTLLGGTTGMGRGASLDAPPRTGDPKVDAEDRAVDRQVNSICKGC
jgi:hypothetical protein